MNKSARDICNKNQLWTLIKKVGEYYKEDLEFLKEYAKEVYENNDVLLSIECFKNLSEQFSPEKFKL